MLGPQVVPHCTPLFLYLLSKKCIYIKMRFQGGTGGDKHLPLGQWLIDGRCSGGTSGGTLEVLRGYTHWRQSKLGEP